MTKTDELFTFCQEMKENHSICCKRYDDASGYTRSGNENIRTESAKKEERLSRYYEKLGKILGRYQRIEEVLGRSCINKEDCCLVIKEIKKIING